MSVGITDENHVALFDSTMELAFGPMFKSAEEANDFLEWLRLGEENERSFPYSNDVILSDPRTYRTDELFKLQLMFRDEKIN